MRRQHRAEEVGTVRAHQLAGVVRQDVHHVPVVRPRPQGPRGGHGPVAVSNLTAGEGRRGRREPSGRGRLYGNMHHNSLGQRHLTDCRVRFVPEERGFFFSLFWRGVRFFLYFSQFFPPFLQTWQVSRVQLRAQEGWRRELRESRKVTPPVRDTTGSANLACFLSPARVSGTFRELGRTSPAKFLTRLERVLNGRAARSRPLSRCVQPPRIYSLLQLSLTLTQRIPRVIFFLRKSAKNLRAVVQKKKVE